MLVGWVTIDVAPAHIALNIPRDLALVPKDPTRLEDFLAYSGAGSEPAFSFESHKYGYDFETLEKTLRMSGFTNIRRCSFMQSVHPELRVDDASSVARARFGERYYSLFVEAQRPAS
jgi:hypothetical protein